MKKKIGNKMCQNIPCVSTVLGGGVGGTGMIGGVPIAGGATVTKALSTSETVILPPGPLPFTIYDTQKYQSQWHSIEK